MTAPEVHELHEPGRLQGLLDEWRTLAERLPGTSYFQSPEWALAWWEHLADRPLTQIAMWRGDDGLLEAIAAVSKRSERLHRRIGVPISFWTNTGSGPGAADHTGFPALEHRRPDIRAWLGTLDGSVLIRNAADGSRDLLPEDAECIEESICPRLAIPPGDGPIGRSAKYRKRLRRNSRILRERGVEFRAVPGPEITDHMLDRLMEMHEERSDDLGWSTTFTPERIAFHRSLVTTSAPGRGPGLMLAETSDDIVGVLYGFWWRDSFSYFQTGWNPDYWELSLGSALVYEAVLHARTMGATTFDFLRGPEDYKYRFGAEDHTDRTWLLARGASGRALAAKARVG
jgi:CelD/BcsL family acetyltransferase involved in cellulose biosynthesis